MQVGKGVVRRACLKSIRLSLYLCKNHVFRHITLGGLYLPMVTRSNSLIGLTEFQLMLNFDLDIILISLQTSARLVSHSHIYNYKSVVTMILAMSQARPQLGTRRLWILFSLFFIFLVTMGHFEKHTNYIRKDMFSEIFRENLYFILPGS